MTEDEMIRENIGLVYMVANRYRICYDYDDIVSEGMIGLLKAVRLYEPERGMFSTFAAKTIRNEILKHFRSRNRKKSMVDKTISLDARLDEDTDTVIGDFVRDNTNIENGVITKAMIGDFKKRLPPRSVYILQKFAEGFSQREIGKMLNCTGSAVSKVICDAKRRFYKICRICG